MAGTVVTAATGVLGSLLSKLTELRTEQYMQRKGVRRDIDFLCGELTNMKAALEKLAGMEKLDVQTKVWRNEVREMAYDIEDNVDIFMCKLGQQDDDDKDGLFHKIARKARELLLHYQLANKIQELRARVEEQSQSRDRYWIDESISESRVVEVDPRLPAMFEDAKRLVGIDGAREEITKLLMEDDDHHSQQLKVLSIVGFGGLGKTTLANQVYSEIKNEFECKAFVTVSRTPHIPKILKDILSKVGCGGMEMEDDVQKLIENLRAKFTNKRQLKVVSTVGFGGLGKTTLANQVYAKIKNEFKCTAFVSVSRTPHMPKILKDILSAVGYDGKKVEDVQNLIDILRAWLMHKRYFVIIDDLWSITDWDIIKCAFVNNNNASRVITTTRNQEVGTACCFPSQGRVYQMQRLDELHSRRLFFKRLFGTEDSCPEQFREISDQMLRKCKGVPLAITSIASLLANYKHIEIWKKIQNSLGSELETNPTMEWMRHVLSLSYNDLFYELKTCLLYVGMYPEDYIIPKEELVRKWMAEGFIREKHGLDLEETAENCFNELINRSMIQPCFIEDEVTACRVHDLMLDLIILECKEENFITINDKYPMNGASKVRRISHQFNNRDMPLAVESMSASTVRSYISFHVIKSIPPLLKFELLRVLEMTHSFSKDRMCLDLSAINHLFLLKYVRVNGFLLKLPNKFGKLKHLMTLDMSQSWFYGSSKQLSDFSSLLSLRHLKLRGFLTFENGLSKLCNLRDLSGFDIVVNSIQCIRDLGELTELRELGVSWPPGGVENNPKTTTLAASLVKLGKSNLRSLVFEDPLEVEGESAVELPSGQFWSNCLARPRHLQKFYLPELIIMPKLPNWIAYADRLADIWLEVQELRSDDVQVLAQLPCLIDVLLTAGTVPDKNIIIHPNTFPSLKYFSFYCDERPRWTFEPAAMQRLQRLHMDLNLFMTRPGAARVQGAMQLEGGSPVDGIEHLASLQDIDLVTRAKRGMGYEIESACRDAISRHPKSQAIKIRVHCSEYDENELLQGKAWR